MQCFLWNLKFLFLQFSLQFDNLTNFRYTISIQRMLNNTLKRSTASKKSQSCKYPLFSSNKSSRKYHTPFKSNLTTLNTNNNTLSLYSNQSRYQNNRCLSENLQRNQEGKSRVSSKLKQVKSGSCSKSKSKVKNLKKSSKYVDKENFMSKSNKQTTKMPEKIVTNKELYKGLRESLNSQNTTQILSRISQIFDLVLSNAKIPYEIQTFLYEPLEILKARLKFKGKSEIGATLTQFKNNCMEIIKSSSSSEITLFQRMQLPQNLRWSSLNNFSTIKKQQQLQSRLGSFQRLKKKDNTLKYQEDEALNRIQTRLDDFLCKSVKYRKVYL